MTERKHLILVFLGALLCFATNGHTSSHEERELVMAHHAILGSLATKAKLGTGKACRDEPYACVVAEPIDLALALIAAKRSSSANRSLASLVKYQLDGTAASDYECHILQHGKTVKPYLKSINAESAFKECESELRDLTRRHPQLFSGIEVGLVCASKENIEANTKDLLGAIDAKMKCDSDW